MGASERRRGMKKTLVRRSKNQKEIHAFRDMSSLGGGGRYACGTRGTETTRGYYNERGVL